MHILSSILVQGLCKSSDDPPPPNRFSIRLYVIWLDKTYRYMHILISDYMWSDWIRHTGTCTSLYQIICDLIGSAKVIYTVVTAMTPAPWKITVQINYSLLWKKVCKSQQIYCRIVNSLYFTKYYKLKIQQYLVKCYIVFIFLGCLIYSC